VNDKLKSRKTLPVDDTLCLTELLPTDAKQLVYILQDPTIARWCTNVPHPYTTADAKHWVTLQHNKTSDDPTKIWAMRLTSNNTLVGQMGLNRYHPKDHVGELGYWVDGAHTQKGYATRSLAILMQHWQQAFPLKTLYAWVKLGNHSSVKVLLNNGFERSEGHKTEHETLTGQNVFLHRYQWTH
jgi:RimJ/RimL family protein N-acetyltransferase